MLEPVRTQARPFDELTWYSEWICMHCIGTILTRHSKATMRGRLTKQNPWHVVARALLEAPARIRIQPWQEPFSYEVANQPIRGSNFSPQ